jgi:allantoin racemase
MYLPRARLVNPNTNASTTVRMLAAASDAAKGRITLEGVTAPFGASLITDEAELDRAAEAVLSLVPALTQECQGLIVAAFGDPGVGRLRTLTAIPVVGIGEAGIREAAAGGRRFCIVTTTPGLVVAIDHRVTELGFEANYAGVVLTKGDAVAITNDPSRLESELAAAIGRAVGELGVEAVVVGGGPLSDAARRLAEVFSVPIVQPVAAALRQLLGAIDA